MKRILILLIVIAGLMYVGCDKVSNPEFNVDAASCNSCGECIQVCPYDAIDFGEDGKAFIDQTKCTQCGECVEVCPKDAIH